MMGRGKGTAQKWPAGRHTECSQLARLLVVLCSDECQLLLCTAEEALAFLPHIGAIFL